MDLQFTAEDEAFRQEVREFVQANLPTDIATDTRCWVIPRHDYWRRWQKTLADRGWGAPHWPVRWGGTDWSPMRKHIFSEYFAFGPMSIFLFERASTIFGGSREVQKNIIAKAAFGF